jgi:hypothetical protein
MISAATTSPGVCACPRVIASARTSVNTIPLLILVLRLSFFGLLVLPSPFVFLRRPGSLLPYPNNCCQGDSPKDSFGCDYDRVMHDFRSDIIIIQKIDRSFSVLGKIGVIPEAKVINVRGCRLALPFEPLLVLF